MRMNMHHLYWLFIALILKSCISIQLNSPCCRYRIVKSYKPKIYEKMNVSNFSTYKRLTKVFIELDIFSVVDLLAYIKTVFLSGGSFVDTWQLTTIFHSFKWLTDECILTQYILENNYTNYTLFYLQIVSQGSIFSSTWSSGHWVSLLAQLPANWKIFLIYLPINS